VTSPRDPLAGRAFRSALSSLGDKNLCIMKARASVRTSLSIQESEVDGFESFCLNRYNTFNCNELHEHKKAPRTCLKSPGCR